jgi:hypothetical protein
MRDSKLRSESVVLSEKKPKFEVPWDNQTVLPDGREILKEAPKFDYQKLGYKTIVNSSVKLTLKSAKIRHKKQNSSQHPWWDLNISLENIQLPSLP